MADRDSIKEQVKPILESFSMLNTHCQKVNVRVWELQCDSRKSEIRTIKQLNELVRIKLPSNTELKFMDSNQFMQLKLDIEQLYNGQVQTILLNRQPQSNNNIQNSTSNNENQDNDDDVTLVGTNDDEDAKSNDNQDTTLH